MNDELQNEQNEAEERETNEFVTSELSKMLTDERKGRIQFVASHRTTSLTLLLDHLHHPHNISAIIRSADAFGLRDIHMIRNESDEQGVSGISLGSEKWVQVRCHSSEAEAVANLKKEGFMLVGLVPPPLDSNIRNSSENLVSITDVPFEKKIALVFGSELRGLSPGLNDSLDIRSFIPMFGFVESFNVSVACALSLFCSMLAPTKVVKRTAPLGERESKELCQQWVRASIKNSDLIEEEIRKRRLR